MGEEWLIGLKDQDVKGTWKWYITGSDDGKWCSSPGGEVRRKKFLISFIFMPNQEHQLRYNTGLLATQILEILMNPVHQCGWTWMVITGQ